MIEKHSFPLFVSSNTKRLDFHTIVQPNDAETVELISKMLTQRKLCLCESNHFTIFARKIQGRFFVGVMCYARELNGLDKEFFLVDRGQGKTPTQLTIVLEMTGQNRVPISKELLTSIVSPLFKDGAWLDASFPTPRTLSLVIDGESKRPKRLFKPRKYYDSVEKMLHCFNRRLLKSKRGFNLTYTTSKKYEAALFTETHIAFLENQSNSQNL